MILWDLEQGTPEWYACRLALPTASEFSKLVTPAKMEPSKQLDDYALQLAAEAFSQQQVDTWAGNVFTENGHAMEAAARAYYSMSTMREVRQAGFVRSELYEAGMSPDGLMLPDEGSLEIKSCGYKQHIRCLAMTECPRDYLSQAQGEILVGWEEGVRWVDLTMYHDTLPPKVFRVEPIPKFQDLLKRQIEKVCQQRDHYLRVIEDAA